MRRSLRTSRHHSPPTASFSETLDLVWISIHTSVAFVTPLAAATLHLFVSEQEHKMAMPSGSAVYAALDMEVENENGAGPSSRRPLSVSKRNKAIASVCGAMVTSLTSELLLLIVTADELLNIAITPK